MKYRLIIKTISYGMMHLVVATTVAYIITDDITVSLSIGIIEPMAQTVMFAIHDYLWDRKS